MVQDIIHFMEDCPTPYHFVKTTTELLKNSGFDCVQESFKDISDLPDKGYIVRSNRCILAYQKGGIESSVVTCTNIDSPCLRFSNFGNNIIFNFNNDDKILLSSFIDRDLRVCGMIYLQDGKERLFDSIEGVAILPSSSPYYENSLTPSIDLNKITPVIGINPEKSIIEYIAEKLNLSSSKEIESWDLYLIDAENPNIIGSNKDFICGHGINNLGSSYLALLSFLKSKPTNTLKVFVAFNNEEIGHNTIVSAESNFLMNFFEKIHSEPGKLISFLSKSYILTINNSEATHPNYKDKINSPILGNGVVINNSISSNNILNFYLIKKIAKNINIPLQFIFNKNDESLGAIISKTTGIYTIELGLAQLSMHSFRGTIAKKDLEYLTKLLIEIYSTNVIKN